jgi:arginase
MSGVTLITAPYELGRAGVGLGTGVPVLADALAGDGVEVVPADPEEPFTNEVAASFAVTRAVAARVRGAVHTGRLPVVLAGNCNNAAVGAVAGLGTPPDLGVVWFDAHPDFQTDDTTTSGFFDGMALSLVTGTGWAALRATVDGLRAVPEEHVVHAFAHDMEAPEEERLDSSRVRRVRPGEELEPALDELAERVSEVYLHVDLDVLDPSVGRANRYAAANGPDVDVLEHAIEQIGRRFRIRAAALTAYEPAEDPEAAIPAAALRIFSRIVESSRVGSAA